MAIVDYTPSTDMRIPAIPRMRDLIWTAGILEGEGSFYWKWSPVIMLAMTDEDIVQRVADLFGYEVKSYQPKRPNAKHVYTTRAAGARAAAWMMTLYPLLGKRRQTDIARILIAWRQSPGFPRGRKGERLPAICHPKRLRVANGLCKQCYNRDFQAKWRKNPLHGTAALCHPEKRNHGYGLCSACYQKRLHSQRKSQPILTPALCHPELRQYAKGLCKNCYQRQSYERRKRADNTL